MAWCSGLLLQEPGIHIVDFLEEGDVADNTFGERPDPPRQEMRADEPEHKID
jgi:hypothetical protein